MRFHTVCELSFLYTRLALYISGLYFFIVANDALSMHLLAILYVIRLSFRLRLFVGLVMVRALHFLFLVIYGSKWRALSASTFQYCTSSDLSFTSIRAFSDIVVVGNDGTYRALHLLFVLIYASAFQYCTSWAFVNRWVFSPNRCGFDHVFCVHKKKSLYSFNHQFTRHITTLNHLFRQGTFINV
jgi:hypothetical protein